MNECDDPDITVIVTVYKRYQYLRDALNSVRLQSLEGRRLEVIVADDGASTDVQRIVEELGQTYVHYRPNDTRMGVALSVREALRSARGRYVAIINDDDLWEQDFLRELIAPLKRTLAACWPFAIIGSWMKMAQSTRSPAMRSRGASDARSAPAVRLQKLHVQPCWTRVFLWRLARCFDAVRWIRTS